MIHVPESSAFQSSALASLRQAGKTQSTILGNTVKIRPSLLVGIAAFCAWVLMRLVVASAGGSGLALLGDAGHQVGSGGLWGAPGATYACAASFAYAVARYRRATGLARAAVVAASIDASLQNWHLSAGGENGA